MATNTQLQQLLQEDQEPFHLLIYIAERRTKLKPSSSINQLQLPPIAKPMSDSSNRESSLLHFPATFFKNGCFNGENGSPEVLNRGSPVFSLTKSPVKLLQIPSKTAALLLEAALRIHQHSSRKRTSRFGTDFSFFGSFLKKLSVKTHNQGTIDPDKHQTTTSKSSESGRARRDTNLSESDMNFCFNERRSDAVWSEDKSLDTETSCSSSNSTRTAGEHTQSPSRCLSPSPSRCTVKDVEEGKEQCSPVCVLDPPFEQAGDDHNHHHDDERYGCECSYTIVESMCPYFLAPSLLVSDLMDEEEMEDKVFDCRNEGNEVCATFRLWNGVQQNTIDMMIEEDLREEWCEWKMNKEELRLVALDVEVVIFESLVRDVCT